jgi:hypothetical protein
MKWICLGEELRRHAAEREARVDELVGQTFCRCAAAIEDRPEADFARIADAVVDRVERVAVVEIGGVDRVSGCAQLVGERLDAVRQSLRMVEQEYLRHELS